MTKEELEKILNEEDHKLLEKNTLPNHDQLVNYLRVLCPTTGDMNKLFCNSFMLESVELLKHGVFLFEDGYFDCAFYSIRQSIENMNNMLLVSSNEAKYTEWKAKQSFPTDSHVKSLLQKINCAYSELKALIPEVFEKYDELLKKANKYIHKQGFDTFFVPVYLDRDIPKVRANLFEEFLKSAIGLILIMHIVLDPLSLALSDPEIDSFIPFDSITEPIPIGIIRVLLDDSIIDRIKTADFYKDFSTGFLSNEKMNEATYNVVRYQYFDVNALDEIEKQSHFLNAFEQLFLNILRKDFSISHFYLKEDFFGYTTSIKPTYELHGFSSNQFDAYITDECKKNIVWKEMFISVYRVFDTYMILQHNEALSESELSLIQKIVDRSNQQYLEHMIVKD